MTEISITRDNIKKGWSNNTCPIHRAVARTFHIPYVYANASPSGVGYYNPKDYPHGGFVDLDFSAEDWNYLIEVMTYADEKLNDVNHYSNTPEPKFPPARKVKVLNLP